MEDGEKTPDIYWEGTALPREHVTGTQNRPLIAAARPSLITPPKKRGKLMPFACKVTVLDGSDLENQISRDRE